MTGATQFVWRQMQVFDGHATLPQPMAVGVANGKIDLVCKEQDLDEATLAGRIELGRGGVLTPGLIDCHTHLVFAGERAGEFEQRLEGVSYAEISRAGGGINATVNATRAASADTLFELTVPRLAALVDDGVSTVEIKSGYGLNVADELKSLRVARALGDIFPVRVRTTFLGAHSVPPEYADRSDAYVDLVCEEMIPAVAAEGLADAVDVFCEGIAFSVAQCERIYAAAQAHGLPVKAHVEQLSNLGGAAAAARFQALSVDHLEHLDDAGIAAIKEAGSVAVLLPGASYTLRETQHPPVAALRAAGVPMAVATNANPGSSPVFSPTLILNMACTVFQLTPQEALAGMTGHAARALGLSDVGVIKPGAVADICVWNAGQPAELAYAIQQNRLRQRMLGGKLLSL